MRSEIPSQAAYDRSATLIGTDPMPFGKHKGMELRRVSQWYLKWFLEQGFREYWPALRDYAQKRLGIDVLPTIIDKRPHGPAMPPTAWVGAKVSGESEDAPF